MKKQYNLTLDGVNYGAFISAKINETRPEKINPATLRTIARATGINRVHKSAYTSAQTFRKHLTPTEKKTPTPNDFIALLHEYGDDPKNSALMLKLSNAVVKCVYKKLLTVGAGSTAGADPSQIVDRIRDTFGDDLVQECALTLWQYAKNADKLDLEKTFEIERPARQIVYKTTDRPAKKTVETSIIKEAFKSVRAFIYRQNTAIDSKYQYIEIDADPETTDIIMYHAGVYYRVPLLYSDGDARTFKSLDKLIARLTLTDRQKTIIHKRLQGATLDEIATRLDRSKQTVLNDLQVIRAKATETFSPALTPDRDRVFIVHEYNKKGAVRRVGTYSSIKAIARALDLDPRNISKYARARRPYKGYTFTPFDIDPATDRIKHARAPFIPYATRPTPTAPAGYSTVKTRTKVSRILTPTAFAFSTRWIYPHITICTYPTRPAPIDPETLYFYFDGAIMSTNICEW